MIEENKPFPFGNEGPPDKLTEAQKREHVPDEIRGYLPPISMASAAQLRREGVSPLSIIVLQLLIREKKIESSRYRGTDKLRVPSSVRRNLRIDGKVYRQCLEQLERVDAVHITKGTKWTAAIKIDTETQVRDTLVDKYGQRRERRW